MQFKIKKSTTRVLIADDDAVIRHVIAAVVKQQGYTPIEVKDGREVCRLLQSDADFKFAILDMSMPYLTGIDLIRYMQTEKRLMRIPILLVTAEQNIKLLADSFGAGATAFLPKPFTPEQLQTTLGLLAANGSISQAA
jgi:two-component system chemotaxis response regulator CheY